MKFHSWVAIRNLIDDNMRFGNPGFPLGFRTPL